MQQATGFEDPVEEMVKYLTATSKEPEPDKIRAYCEGSVEHFDWLEKLGFEFERSYYPEKAVIQPGTEGLMFTGNEKVWPYLEQAAPAPRGHKVPVPGDTEGTKMVMDLLRDRVEEAGVEVRYETGATNLVGRLVRRRASGWPGESFDETGVVARRSVVLAAGGFVMNPDMVAEHTPALGSKLFTLGSTYDDGLGIRLGASVGGELKHMDEPFITAPFYPPSVLVKGLIVNKLGKRFVAEDSYHARTSYHVMAQPDAAAYLIVDSEHVEHPRDAAGARSSTAGRRSRRWRPASSLPAGSLVATLARYNEHAARGEDPDFHKHPDWLAAQDTGPWGAYDLTLGKALYAGFTLGGLRVTVDGQVQRVRRLGRPGSVRRRCLRLEPRPGRCRLLLRHPARRGVVLRAAGGRHAAGESPAAGELVPGVEVLDPGVQIRRLPGTPPAVGSPRDRPVAGGQPRQRAAVPRHGPAGGGRQAPADATATCSTCWPASRAPARRRRCGPRRSGCSRAATRSATRRRSGSSSCARRSPATTSGRTASTSTPTR